VILEAGTRVAPTLAYIGPDVLMPFASAIAAAVGILLMFGRRAVAFGRRILQAVVGIFRRS
jgi:hypothetical protein